VSRHGRACMPFGKFKGCAVRSLPTDYLDWLAGRFSAPLDGFSGIDLSDSKWDWLCESVMAEMKHRGLNVDHILETRLASHFAYTESDKPCDWQWPIHDAAHVRLAIQNFIYMPPAMQQAATGKIIAAAKKFGITNFSLGDIQVREKQLSLADFENLPQAEKNKLSEKAFELHRARGESHCKDFHPYVIGGCDCYSLALKDFHPIAEVTSVTIDTGKKKIKFGKGRIYVAPPSPDASQEIHAKVPRRRIILER
jgi:hypothetical protein